MPSDDREPERRFASEGAAPAFAGGSARGPSAACAETERSSASASALIGERYRLEGTLGRGGMGVVFAAVHVHTQRPVALKLVDCPWASGNSTLYQRFLGEARAAAAVRHPNVVDVLDMGYHEGAPYLVMERLAGESLEQVLDRVAVLPLQTVLAWLLPIMGALAALHEKGIVHRDIKPSNIFLAKGIGHAAVPKLLDFGLAQAASETPLTQPGMMLGTPEYMAPERVRGLSVGPTADVWAMGVVLFECLCGRVPFSATDLNGVAAQVLAGEVLKLIDTGPHVPPQVSAVIDRALAPEPTQRHTDMASFAYELAAAARAAGVVLPTNPDPVGLPAFSAQQLEQCQPPSAIAGPEQATAPLTLRQPISTRRPAHTWMALGALSVAMLAAGATTWALWPEASAHTPHSPLVAAPAPTQRAPAPSTIPSTLGPPRPGTLANGGVQPAVEPLPALAPASSAPTQPVDAPPASRPSTRRSSRTVAADPAAAGHTRSEPRDHVKASAKLAGEFEKEWL